MKKLFTPSYVAAVAGLTGALVLSAPLERTTAAQAIVLPQVFQAIGPDIASLQPAIDAFRAALGANNGNAPGPLPGGRREINWDGGGSTATAVAGSPFNGFLANRGARFETTGSGFVQAPAAGIATTFANPSYAGLFQAFSPVRLFSPIGSNQTVVKFFVPGGSAIPATTSAFGAIFSDVDRPAGVSSDFVAVSPGASTTMRFLAADGRNLLTVPVVAAPGDGNFSFVGIVFDDPFVAQVVIKSGDAAPGPNDTAGRDIVMMDDFIYGEPQMLVL